jgi:predicted permease
MSIQSARLATAYPDFNKDRKFTPVLFQDRLVRDVRPAIVMLFGSVVLLLFIAAANVGNILLTRTIQRAPENALRVALGASFADLTRLSMIEGTLLSCVGALAGTGLAWGAVRTLAGLGLDWLPRAAELSLDQNAFLFSAGLALVTPILFSLAPLLQLKKTRLSDALRESARGGGRNRRSLRLRRGLVAVEAALAVILLIAAGLLIKSFWQLSSVNTGFDAQRILTLRVAFSPARYPGDQEVTNAVDAVNEALGAIPGVLKSAAVSDLPMSGQVNSTHIHRLDRPQPSPGHEYTALVRAITPEYFSVMGVPLHSGRMFDANDDSRAGQVAIINQLMASQLFAGEDPIGRKVSVRGVDRDIVGVAGNVKQFGLAQPGRPALYEPSSQETVEWVRSTMTFVVETAGPTEDYHQAVRQAIRSVDPRLPVNGLRGMAGYIFEDLAAPRFRTGLALSFAAIATFLAGVGLAAVMAFSVSQRTREVAIRMSVGATRSQVYGSVMAEGLKLAAAGAVAGLAGAGVLSHLMASLLFETPPNDWAVMLAVPGVLLVVAALATSVPALRAIHVEPATALRQQ